MLGYYAGDIFIGHQFEVTGLRSYLGGIPRVSDLCEATMENRRRSPDEQCSAHPTISFQRQRMNGKCDAADCDLLLKLTGEATEQYVSGFVECMKPNWRTAVDRRVSAALLALRSSL